MVNRVRSTAEGVIVRVIHPADIDPTELDHENCHELLRFAEGDYEWLFFGDEQIDKVWCEPVSAPTESDEATEHVIFVGKGG